MMTWTVTAAKECGLFHRIVVTTDDDEIASIAAAEGAEVFKRPALLSDDRARLIDVVKFTLDQLSNHRITEFCLLLPNCPLRPASEILRSAQVWREKAPSALMSVTDYGWTPPFRAQTMRSDGFLEPAFPDMIDKKGQDVAKPMCPSGAIYWARREDVVASDSLYLRHTMGFEMPWHLAIDIDTPSDLALAACVSESLGRGFDFCQSLSC